MEIYHTYKKVSICPWIFFVIVVMVIKRSIWLDKLSGHFFKKYKKPKVSARLYCKFHIVRLISHESPCRYRKYFTSLKYKSVYKQHVMYPGKKLVMRTKSGLQAKTAQWANAVLRVVLFHRQPYWVYDQAFKAIQSFKNSILSK